MPNFINPRSLAGGKMMHSKTKILLGIGFLALASLGIGLEGRMQTATIRVPSDYATIQAAIDAAHDGDEIIVSQGKYGENIKFNGKNIYLHSINPKDWNVVKDTVIDGYQSGSVVTFHGTEGSTCTLEGFTITNGKAGVGAGI